MNRNPIQKHMSCCCCCWAFSGTNTCLCLYTPLFCNALLNTIFPFLLTFPNFSPSLLSTGFCNLCCAFCWPVTPSLALFSVRSRSLNGLEAVLPTAEKEWNFSVIILWRLSFLAQFLCPPRCPFGYSDVLKKEMHAEGKEAEHTDHDLRCQREKTGVCCAHLNLNH